jgi:hypothetical protein
MDSVGSTERAGRTTVGHDPADARADYREYRRRQAADLLSLVPREAIRPLYRLARKTDAADSADSLGLLTAFCEMLLPLPPFDVWRDDRRAHPAAYLDEAERGPRSERSHDHVTVEIRVVEHGGDLWNAELDVRSEGNLWRGHVTFRSAGRPEETHSTGEIFRELGAEAVRDRFLEFDDHTLRAFLRSVLP